MNPSTHTQDKAEKQITENGASFSAPSAWEKNSKEEYIDKLKNERVGHCQLASGAVLSSYSCP